MENQLLSLLTREGVLVKVSVSFWRGCKKLKAEDLGLKSADVSDRLISLGHKRLLPKEATAALTLVEGRAHTLVESSTFPFLNGLAHFLPNAKLAEVTGKLQELEREFWRAKDAFLKQYGSLRSDASTEWYRMAAKLVNDPDRYVSSIEAAFPLPNRMDRYYGFNIQLFQISVPARLGVDLLTLADQQQVMAARDRAAREASAQIRQGVHAFVADCVASLREQTSQLCREMLASINGCETGVHQKTLNRLVRFIDQFKHMNFANDAAMENQLEQVRRELLSRTAEEYRDSAHARRKLREGLEQLANKAGELARTDTTELIERFGEIGRRKFHLAA